VSRYNLLHNLLQVRTGRPVRVGVIEAVQALRDMERRAGRHPAITAQ
jgi:hypothetical protein